MHDFVVRHQQWRQIRPLKREIEHMTVEAPVRPKDQQQALVSLRRFLFGLL